MTTTVPRRLTGPWDEAIVKAYRVWESRGFPGLDLDTDGRRAAERAAMYIPGEPATLYVGSDSYRMLVVAVDRYKSGAKRGQVKAIHAVHLNHDNTPRPSVEWDFTDDQPTYTYGVDTYTRREPRTAGLKCWLHEDRHNAPPRNPADPDCYSCWSRSHPRFVERGGDHCALVVGYADDYRDPHF